MRNELNPDISSVPPEARVFVSEEHIDCYINEFAFRWDNCKETDSERMVRAVEGLKGKRLFYKETINQKVKRPAISWPFTVIQIIC